MTKTEEEIRNALGQSLIQRSEAEEKITQLRAMLQACKSTEAELEKAKEAELEAKRKARKAKRQARKVRRSNAAA